MSTYNFEPITAVGGSDFFAWGNDPGQILVGIIRAYDPVGGQTFNGDPCPQLELELVEPVRSIASSGAYSEHAKGEMITLTAGQASLKRLLSATPLPMVGDVIRIHFDSKVKTASGGMMKHFDVQIARQPKLPTRQGPTAAEVEAPF